MTDRDRVLRAVLTRAKKAGRVVYGYSSEKASCAELDVKKGVPETWDRICVEGDRVWTVVPVAEEPWELNARPKRVSKPR